MDTKAEQNIDVAATEERKLIEKMEANFEMTHRQMFPGRAVPKINFDRRVVIGGTATDDRKDEMIWVA